MVYDNSTAVQVASSPPDRSNCQINTQGTGAGAKAASGSSQHATWPFSQVHFGMSALSTSMYHMVSPAHPILTLRHRSDLGDGGMS